MKLYRIAETHGIQGHNYQTAGVLETDSHTLRTIEGILTRLKPGVYRYQKVNDTPSGIFTYLQVFVPGRRDVRLGYTTVDSDELYTIQCGKEYAYATELDKLVMQPALQEWKEFIGTVPAKGSLQIVARTNSAPRVLCVELAKDTIYDLRQEILDSIEEPTPPKQGPIRPVDTVPTEVLL
jgi:hypothetical protein